MARRPRLHPQGLRRIHPPLGSALRRREGHDAAVGEHVRTARTSPDIPIGTLLSCGWKFHLRMISLNPPFNNSKARQAVQMLVESRQESYLSATGQSGDLGKVCLAPFVCGSPNESMVGTEKFQKYDPDKIKALFKEGGYTGEPIGLMDPTTQQNLHFLALRLNEHRKALC